METKWLEDFVSLAETHSFSRSAQLRHVTQPAFSRRIQALEAWAGIDLVDRSFYPTRLTPAGQTFHAQALDILGALQSTRNMMRGHQAGGQDMIEFAVPHSLAFTFFPHWVTDLRKRFGALKSRLIALNVHDAVMQLTEGSCDLLIAYHHPSQPLQLNPERYEMLSLGHETLAAYAKAGPDGKPTRDDEGNKDFLSSETDLSSSLDTIDALSMTVFGIKNGIALAVWWPAIRTSLFIWNANLIMMQSNI